MALFYARITATREDDRWTTRPHPRGGRHLRPHGQQRRLLGCCRISLRRCRRRGARGVARSYAKKYLIKGATRMDASHVSKTPRKGQRKEPLIFLATHLDTIRGRCADVSGNVHWYLGFYARTLTCCVLFEPWTFGSNSQWNFPWFIANVPWTFFVLSPHFCQGTFLGSPGLFLGLAGHCLSVATSIALDFLRLLGIFAR